MIAVLILVVGSSITSHDISHWSLDAGAGEFDYMQAGVTSVCYGVSSFQFNAELVNVTAQRCVPDNIFEGNFE